MIDFVKVGERITEYRRRANLSQEELAAKLFVTRQALSKWERGMSVPSIDTLTEISKLFKVSFEEILGLFDREELVLSPTDIFRGHDRSYIVERIANGEVKVELADVFYQLSPNERMYVLHAVRSGKLVCNMDMLYPKLTPPEQRYLDDGIPRLTQGGEQ